MTDLDMRALAIGTFGGEQKADAWLHRPLRELGKKSPMQVVQTIEGEALVRKILGQIALGAAA